jgi:ferritin-like metal-binding protein YciE
MAITIRKEVLIALLSDLGQGAERTATIYEELGQAAQEPAIKEALDAREFISSQILSRLDECFRLLNQKPMKLTRLLHDVFMEDFRKELVEIKSPLARQLFILATASRLMHLRVEEYNALIAAADINGHPATGGLLESCLADKLAFAERTRRLIREQLQKELVAA